MFRLRQLRERIVRVRLLLDCLLSPKPALAAARLMSSLVQVGQERRSLRACSPQLLAGRGQGGRAQR